CCFSKVAATPATLRVGASERSIPTNTEASQHKEDDEPEFPDLIEEDAHMRSASIRGALGDVAHPVRVDVTLRCSASKFADQFAIQFTVINRSTDRVEVEWDHLKELERAGKPSRQP